jgi:negative modulator of initiation of replication
MKTIEIDDDVYFYLLGRTTDGQVSFSDLMRRAFGLDGGLWERPAGRQPRQEIARRELSAVAREGAPPSDLEGWLKSPRFLAATTALGRFMCLLSCLHQKHGDDFASVLHLSGRKRSYFALSAEELEETGTSVFPKLVPQSPYWVVTNTETAKKRQIIESVLRMLGYGAADIRMAVSAI